MLSSDEGKLVVRSVCGKYIFLVLSRAPNNDRHPMYILKEADVSHPEYLMLQEVTMGLVPWESIAQIGRHGYADADRKHNVQFDRFPETCPLKDGAGWQVFRALFGSDHFLYVRELPMYNRDAWNPAALDQERFPFHFASLGCESAESEVQTASCHGLLGHLVWHFGRGYEVHLDQLADKTMREQLRK